MMHASGEDTTEITVPVVSWWNVQRVLSFHRVVVKGHQRYTLAIDISAV